MKKRQDKNVSSFQDEGKHQEKHIDLKKLNSNEINFVVKKDTGNMVVVLVMNKNDYLAKWENI